MAYTLFKFIRSVLFGNDAFSYILLQKYDDHSDWAKIDSDTFFILWKYILIFVLVIRIGRAMGGYYKIPLFTPMPCVLPFLRLILALRDTLAHYMLVYHLPDYSFDLIIFFCIWGFTWLIYIWPKLVRLYHGLMIDCYRYVIDEDFQQAVRFLLKILFFLMCSLAFITLVLFLSLCSVDVFDYKYFFKLFFGLIPTVYNYFLMPLFSYMPKKFNPYFNKKLRLAMQYIVANVVLRLLFLVAGRTKAQKRARLLIAVLLYLSVVLLSCAALIIYTHELPLTCDFIILATLCIFFGNFFVIYYIYRCIDDLF